MIVRYKSKRGSVGDAVCEMHVVGKINLAHSPSLSNQWVWRSGALPGAVFRYKCFVPTNRTQLFYPTFSTPLSLPIKSPFPSFARSQLSSLATMRLRLRLLRPPTADTPLLSGPYHSKHTLTTQSVKKVRVRVRFTVTNSGVLHRSFEATAGVLNSPKLGKKWMDYQGINNWEGLLDPLDDHLRNEILRYGKFVEAAYRSFDFDPASPTYATCKFSKNSLLDRSGLGSTGYELTKNLSATCGVRLPRWIGRGPSWLSPQSSWIGYVAVCQDKEEIARLGRRDVVIAFRGTATCMEWIENLRATLTSLVGPSHDGGPMVESGFWSLYTSKVSTSPSLQEMVREEIGKVIRSYGDEPLSITITGHSLGAALATLAAYDIATTFQQPPLVTVVSFGGPRVGNKSFRCQMEKSGTRILRIVNSDDIITKVPGFVIDNNDVAVGAAGPPLLQSWLQKRMEETQLVYADVGQELRLSSRQSPSLNKRDVATCHDLKTYLHLVNGFASSRCPLRKTATRMLEGNSRGKALI